MIYNVDFDPFRYVYFLVFMPYNGYVIWGGRSDSKSDLISLVCALNGEFSSF